MAFKETLTPILGDAATSYEPEHETTPEFMNGKFKELLDNDLELLNKINVLNDYKYPIGITTPNILPSGKWYMRSADNPTDDFYYIDCGISPVSGYTYQKAKYVFGGQLYERIQTGNTWQPWQQIATTTQINVLKTVTSKNYSPINGVTSDSTIFVTKICGVVSISWYGLKRPTSTDVTAVILDNAFKPARDFLFAQNGVTVTSGGILRIEKDNLSYDTITYVAKEV